MRVTRSRALTTALTVAALLALFVRPAAAAPAANLANLRNNVGIAQTPLSNANFDNVGYSFSSVALQLAGVTGGSTVNADGFAYTWPNVASGASDNVVARGQIVPVTVPQGATKLGFLSSADHGPSTGKFILTYEHVDETGATVTTTVEKALTFSDWTLAGGTGSSAPGNITAITTNTRVLQSAVPDNVKAYVFSVSLALDTTKTLKSIKLPTAYSGGIHIFDIATK